MRRLLLFVLSNIFSFWLGSGVVYVTHAQTLPFAPSPAAIAPGAFSSIFPGWKPLPLDSRDEAKAITEYSMNAYRMAYEDAQGQVGEIAALTPSVSLVGPSTDTIILQHISQLLADLVTIEAVDHAEQLNEKSQDLATQSRSWSEWLGNLL